MTLCSLPFRGSKGQSLVLQRVVTPLPAMTNSPLPAASLVSPVLEVLMRKEDSADCDHSQKDWWPGLVQLSTTTPAPWSLGQRQERTQGF